MDVTTHVTPWPGEAKVWRGLRFNLRVTLESKFVNKIVFAYYKTELYPYIFSRMITFYKG